MSDKKPDPRKRALFRAFSNRKEAGQLGRELGRIWLYANMSDDFLKAMERLTELQEKTAQQEQELARLRAEKESADERARMLIEEFRQQLEEAKEIEVVAQEEERKAANKNQRQACRGLRNRAGKLIKDILTLIAHYADVIGAITGTASIVAWLTTLYQQNKSRIDALPKDVTEPILRLIEETPEPVSPLPQPESPLQPETPIEHPKVETPQTQRVSYRPLLKFDWVTIPAGSFLMGSDKMKDPAASDSEFPQHRVYLPAYQIARVPVTNAQYKLFVDSSDHDPPRHWEAGQIPKGKEDHPVVQIPWEDARAFCGWAGVRLPTEAEWEKAARGEDGRIYPWGNEPPNDRLCNFNRSIGDTTPVGSYLASASPYECLDMAGNVYEWTSTLFTRYPYVAGDGRDNLRTSGMGRILRGGGYYSPANAVRCASRLGLLPWSWGIGQGFRLARSLSQ